MDTPKKGMPPKKKNNRGREEWVTNLVEYIKGVPKLTFDPEPLFDHLARIEMSYCVGKSLVLFTCVEPWDENRKVRYGKFHAGMSLN